MKNIIKIAAIALVFIFNQKGNAQNTLGLGNVVPHIHSFAVGKDNMVSGNNNYALGFSDTITGTHAFALGAYNVVKEHSYALGYMNRALGRFSYAIGHKNLTTNKSSFAMGHFSLAYGPYSYSFGHYANATGDTSLVIGHRSTASDTLTIAIGNYALAQRSSAIAFGNFVSASANYAMTIGRGVGMALRLENTVSNSLMIGFNSNLPTFFVGGSAGKGKTGNVGIGTSDTKGHKLAVKGSIIAEEIFTKLYYNWPDFVFEEQYALKSLAEVENFIQKNKHLPNVPSSKKIAENGINLGEMDAILLQKIEELTLYTIKQQKLIEQQGILIQRFIQKK
jgi:hypothetical protein